MKKIDSFASKIKKAVESLKALNKIDYLYSPEFKIEILNKIPKSMLQAFARFSREKGNSLTAIEKIAEFLYTEAEIAEEAEIVNVYEKFQPHHRHRPNLSDQYSHHTPKKRVVLTTNVCKDVKVKCVYFF